MAHDHADTGGGKIMPHNKNDIFANRGDGLFIAYVGMETDLIFTQGIDLPGFASFPLLSSDEGCATLSKYFQDQIALAEVHDVGVILESPTWVANRDRGAAIGYSPDDLATFNRDAIALMAGIRETASDVKTILSANIGPRSDAYAPDAQMTAEDAETYHDEQIKVLAETAVDVISGYTLAYAAEAIGIVRAAKRYGLPVVISFTVETDGCLPTGAPLADAIEAVDAATDSYCSYLMINCAHPDHFRAVLDVVSTRRLGGLVANASRCSHAELDNATELDDGNPFELAQMLSDIRQEFPQIRVLGGCCGTDMRHMTEIARAGTSVPVAIR